MQKEILQRGFVSILLYDIRLKTYSKRYYLFQLFFIYGDGAGCYDNLSAVLRKKESFDGNFLVRCTGLSGKNFSLLNF